MHDVVYVAFYVVNVTDMSSYVQNPSFSRETNNCFKKFLCILVYYLGKNITQYIFY